LTVEESIGFALKFKGYKGDTLSIKLSQIIELLSLGDVRKYYGYQLSPGLIKLQLLGIALAQSNSFLVLDEPTSMIDIINKNHIWEVLSESKADKSLLIASHDMNEVKRLCDRIYLIVDGKVIAEGTPEQISGLLKLPCKFSFSTSQSDLTETLLIGKKIEYSLTNAIFYLSVDELNKGIDLIKEINDQTGITYIQFEAPSFDETIMKLVENSHE
jgi:ABC-2 type transport system ATP-binding protein